MRKTGFGKGDLAIAIAIMLAMCVASYLFDPNDRIAGESGLCLPSPNLWDISPIWSWGANTFLLGLIALCAFLLNRHFNFIRSTEPILPAIFLIFAASVPWNNSHLSTSTIICAVNLLNLALLFGCYRKPNATQEIFIIATFLSVGSMFQYAFLPYIIPVALGGMAMKAFRIKEFLALLMGLVAPYWVGIGLTLIPLENLAVPELSNLFNGFASFPDLLILILSVGLAAFIGIVLGINNSFKLYAGNSRVNALNMVVNIMGLVSITCVIIDFTNMMAYLTTFYFSVAVQVANLCALWRLKREWLVILILAMIYVGLFIAMVLG